MSLGQHLIELRRRLMWAALALIVGMVVAFFITDPVIWLITEPIRVVAESAGQEGKVEFMYQTITGPFDMRLRISFAIGILLSAPIWIWQIWATPVRFPGAVHVGVGPEPLAKEPLPSPPAQVAVQA